MCVMCSRIAIDGEPLVGSLAASSCNKILFFSPFSFFNHGKGETNKPLVSKKRIILWNEMIKFYWTFICESDINFGMLNGCVAYIFIKLSFWLLSCFLSISVNYLSDSRGMAFFGDAFWKLLSDLPSRALFPTANDRFSISAIVFDVRSMASTWNLQ